MVELANTSFKFGCTSVPISVGCVCLWTNSAAIASGSAVPANLFQPISTSGDAAPLFKAVGVDFSGLSSSSYLVKISSYDIMGNFTFQDCKLPSGITVMNGTPEYQGSVTIDLDNCDSGNPASGMRSESYRYQGSIKANLTTYLTATDGLAPYSLKMTANAGASYFSPLKTRLIPIWSTLTSGSHTATIQLLYDAHLWTPSNQNVWMNLYYLGTSASTLASLATTQNSLTNYINGSTSALSAGVGAGSWSGTSGMTTPTSVQLQASFSPTEAGFLLAEICFGPGAADTLYVDPTITVA